MKGIGFVGLTILCTHFRSKIRSKKWFFRRHEVNKILLREKKFLLKFRFFVEKSKTVVMRRAQIKTNNYNFSFIASCLIASFRLQKLLLQNVFFSIFDHPTIEYLPPFFQSHQSSFKSPGRFALSKIRLKLSLSWSKSAYPSASISLSVAIYIRLLVLVHFSLSHFVFYIWMA